MASLFDQFHFTQLLITWAQFEWHGWAHVMLCVGMRGHGCNLKGRYRALMQSKVDLSSLTFRPKRPLFKISPQKL